MHPRPRPERVVHPAQSRGKIGIVAQQHAGEIVVADRSKFWNVLGVSRAAIVTRPGAIDYPAVIAQALADDQRIALQVFPSYDEAVAWLQAAPAREAGSLE